MNRYLATAASTVKNNSKCIAAGIAGAAGAGTVALMFAAGDAVHSAAAENLGDKIAKNIEAISEIALCLTQANALHKLQII